MEVEIPSRESVFTRINIFHNGLNAALRCSVHVTFVQLDFICQIGLSREDVDILDTLLRIGTYRSYRSQMVLAIGIQPLKGI